MHRIPLLLLASVLTLALTSTAATAAVTTTELKFDVTVGPPGKEKQCVVDADLHLPDPLTTDGPAPAVLATNGFGGSKDDFDDLGPAYANEGYVFLAYSGLGFGDTEACKITLDSREFDGRAGSQLVDFLGGKRLANNGFDIEGRVRLDDRDKNDPRVGMIGGSYGGQIQFAIAGIDPRLDALVPQITWNDLSYALGPNNTDFVGGVTYDTPGVIKLDWPTLFTAVGASGAANDFKALEQAVRNQDPDYVGSCPNFDDRVCPALARSAAQGYPDPGTLELLRAASVATYIDKIKVPTFLIQGQSDTLFNLQESVATYRALREQGTPVKMLWRDAGHSGNNLGTRESDDTDPEAAYESRLALEWLDHYLKDKGPRPDLDFGFLRDWALPADGDAVPAVGATPAYPAGTDRSLFLSGGGDVAATGEIVDGGGDVEDGRAGPFFSSPATTGGGNGFTTTDVGPDATMRDTPGTIATFTGPPLSGDLDVVGVPTITLSLDAPAHAQSQNGARAAAVDPGPAGNLVLFVRLEDVAPDGTVTLPRDQLAPVRVADVTQPVQIELPGIAHRFAKDHRLRVVVSTSNYVNRSNFVLGPVEVVNDPAAPNVLTIPVLGRQAGPDGSGPSGTTPFESPAPSNHDGGASNDGDPSPAPAEVPGAPTALPAPAGTAPSTQRISRRCASRRAFGIRLRRPRGDRIRSAEVIVNGKRVAVRRGKRVRSSVVLRGLPKGTYHVRIVVRTVKGRTLRSTRTYRTCVPRRA